jgi:uncharacterized protein YciI
MSATGSTEPAKAPRRQVHATSYVVRCRDGASGEALRAAHTAEHLAYIESVMGEINVAGPLFDEDGQRVIGSMYCLQTRSLARAREIVENDPYFRAGVFESVEYTPHMPAAGLFIGGKTW